MNIPLPPNAWFTEQLRRAGVITCARVLAVAATKSSGGTGIFGTVLRLRFTYDAPELGAPTTAIMKVPSSIADNRHRGDLYRLFDREILFYRHVADRVGLRVPRCYVTTDPAGATPLLLLEDLSDFFAADQVRGASPAESTLVCRTIADMHKQWWESPDLDELDWVPTLDDATMGRQNAAVYRASWPIFLERFGYQLPVGAAYIGEWVGDNYETLLRRLTEPPITLVHGDLRLDNVFFSGVGEGRAVPLAFIDWQMTARGRGIYDLGSFLSQSVTVKVRRREEGRLLQEWYNSVGVRPNRYSLADAALDYARAIALSLIYAVAGASIEFQGLRAERLFSRMVERAFTAAVDHSPMARLV